MSNIIVKFDREEFEVDKSDTLMKLHKEVLSAYDKCTGTEYDEALYACLADGINVNEDRAKAIREGKAVAENLEEVAYVQYINAVNYVCTQNGSITQKFLKSLVSMLSSDSPLHTITSNHTRALLNLWSVLELDAPPLIGAAVIEYICGYYNIAGSVNGRFSRLLAQYYLAAHNIEKISSVSLSHSVYVVPVDKRIKATDISINQWCLEYMLRLKYTFGGIL